MKKLDFGTAAAIAAFGIWSGMALGQAVAGAPAFEVASVKPSLPPGAPGRATRIAGPFADAGRASWWNVPLRFYTMQAYGLTIAWRIEGGPSWFASDNFDITGTFPAGTPKEQIPLMLKTLLADRFKMVTHLEMREHSVYALTVGKAGLKIKESPADDTPKGNRMGAGHMEEHKVTLQRFADLLSGETMNMSERPVVDMTGLNRFWLWGIPHRGTYGFGCASAAGQEVERICGAPMICQ